MDVPHVVSTPYINTIPGSEAGAVSGRSGNGAADQELSCAGTPWRWWSMPTAMHSGLGGHISTYASSRDAVRGGVQPFLARRGRRTSRGHGLFPGARHAGHLRAGVSGGAAGRARSLHNFRQELAEGGGLSSYPHPYLMPDFWQFPTVSMGLGPLLSIYQARFNRYLRARGFIERRGAEGLGVHRRRRDGRTGDAGLAHAGVAGEPGQPGLGGQLQPAAAGRPGARQRQDHPGTGGGCSRARAGT